MSLDRLLLPWALFTVAALLSVLLCCFAMTWLQRRIRTLMPSWKSFGFDLGRLSAKTLIFGAQGFTFAVLSVRQGSFGLSLAPNIMIAVGSAAIYLGAICFCVAAVKLFNVEASDTGPASTTYGSGSYSDVFTTYSKRSSYTSAAAASSVASSSGGGSARGRPTSAAAAAGSKSLTSILHGRPTHIALLPSLLLRRAALGAAAALMRDLPVAQLTLATCAYAFYVLSLWYSDRCVL